MSLVTVFVLKSILSDTCISTRDFFLFPFAWSIFFHPVTFSLLVFLGLKWVASCRQHTHVTCFFSIHLATLCLLTGAFSQFTFKVIIDMYVLIAILLIVLWLFCSSSLFLSFSLVLFPCNLMSFFSVVTILFSLFFVCLLQVFGLWLTWCSCITTYSYSSLF